MIIGITGTDGAGKGTVVDYLVKERGFQHYSARAIFIEELERQGESIDRSHMRLIANQLRAKHGNDYVVRLSLERAEKTGDKKIIIDSLRTTAEAETLKNAGGVLVAVDADQKLRYERVHRRRSELDRVSFDTFREQEDLELNDPDPHGMQKQKVIEMADYVIMNNGTFEELRAQVDVVLGRINE